MKHLKALIMSLILSSCTLSMNMIHTEGEASDVVDDMPSNSADVKIPELGALG